jgi:hypothetical protein
LGRTERELFAVRVLERNDSHQKLWLFREPEANQLGRTRDFRPRSRLTLLQVSVGPCWDRKQKQSEREKEVERLTHDRSPFSFRPSFIGIVDLGMGGTQSQEDETIRMHNAF